MQKNESRFKTAETEIKAPRFSRRKLGGLASLPQFRTVRPVAGAGSGGGRAAPAC